MRKTSNSNLGNFTNYLKSMPQNCQSHWGGEKKKSEKQSQPRGAYGTWQLNVIWYPGWDLGTEKGY